MVTSLTKLSTSATRPSWGKPRGKKREKFGGTWVSKKKMRNASDVGSGMKTNWTPVVEEMK